MLNRRKFLGLSVAGFLAACQRSVAKADTKKTVPLVISTWDFGAAANAAAWQVLSKGGRALDAVETGVRVTESDPNITTVGYGGMPDREGRVTLDACIMDEKGGAGSVCALEDIMHPISVARLVMEKTPHVMLVGGGAQAFALANGFKKEELLTENARKEWQKWLEKSQYKPIINIENHDTIGLLAIDKKGDLSGACTTSGMAFKMRGRVGDSPIIGAGLYVDNAVGAATSSGLGEAVLRTLGSFLVVELMRQGKTPQQACEETVKRVIAKHQNYKDFQVGFLAIDKNGQIGAYAIHKGFTYAVQTSDAKSVVYEAPAFL